MPIRNWFCHNSHPGHCTVAASTNLHPGWTARQRKIHAGDAPEQKLQSSRYLHGIRFEAGNGHDSEWIRNYGERLETAVVPTLLERQGNFTGSRLFPCPRDGQSGALFPNCSLPQSRLSPDGIGLLNLYPAPNASEAAFNYRQVSPSLNDVHTSTFRIDYNVGRHRIFWRGTHTADRGFGDRPIPFPQSPTQTQQDGRSTGLTVTSMLTPGMLNSFRFGASMQSLRNWSNVDGNIADYERGKFGINFPYLFGNDKEAPNKIPTVIVNRLQQIDGGIWPSRFATPTYQYQDDFTWIRGAHTMKF